MNVSSYAILQIEVYTIKRAEVGLSITLLLGREQIDLKLEIGTTSRVTGTGQ